jgi:hypothetical protein
MRDALSFVLMTSIRTDIYCCLSKRSLGLPFAGLHLLHARMEPKELAAPLALYLMHERGAALSQSPAREDHERYRQSTGGHAGRGSRSRSREIRGLAASALRCGFASDLFRQAVTYARQSSTRLPAAVLPAGSQGRSRSAERPAQLAALSEEPFRLRMEGQAETVPCSGRPRIIRKTE